MKLNGRTIKIKYLKIRGLGFISVFAFSAYFSMGLAIAARDSVSQSFLIRPWAVGQSITLQTRYLKNSDQTDVETVTYSIVDKDEVKGKKYVWVEVERVGTDGVTLIQKLQVRQPENLDFKNVLLSGIEHGLILNGSLLTPRRVIRKIDLGKNKNLSATNEFEVGADTVKRIEEGLDPSANQELPGQYVIIQDQAIHAQAGDFRTTKISCEPSANAPPSAGTPNPSVQAGGGSANFDAWGSPNVPIWGLVKKTYQFRGEDGAAFSLQTELVSYRESGAVSKITEHPAFISLEQQKRSMEIFSKTRKNPSSPGQ